MKARSTEKATQKAILEYLTLRRVFHWRNNTGTFTSEYKGRRSFVRFGALGSPDIFVVLKPSGRLLGIEVKDTKGKLNPNQVAFQRDLEANGGQYLVALSLDDVTAIL